MAGVVEGLRPSARLNFRPAARKSHSPIPFALVADAGEALLGTASVIASDLAERPNNPMGRGGVGRCADPLAASAPSWQHRLTVLIRDARP